MHLQEERAAHVNTIIIRVGIVLISLGIIYVIRDIVIAILVAIVLASSFEPIIRFLMRFRIPRTGAVISLFTSLAVLAVGLVVYVLPILAAEINSVLQVLPDYLDELTISSEGFLQFQTAIDSFARGTSLTDYLTSTTEALTSFGSDSFAIGSAVFGGISSVIIIVVLSFYLTTQEDGVGDFLRIITPLKYEKYIIGLWRRSQRNIGRWMQGQVFLAVLVGLFSYIGLAALGVRHAFLLGIFAGLFEIIPVFGPILGSIPAIAIGFLDGGVSLALLVAALFVIVQQLESHVMYPIVVRKIVGVPPLIVIISIIIGFKLGGIFGIILSIPVATVLLEYLGDRERTRRVPVE